MNLDGHTAKEWIIFAAYQVARGVAWFVGIMWKLTKYGSQIFWRWVTRGKITRRFPWPL